MIKTDYRTPYPWPAVLGGIILTLFSVCLCSRQAEGQPALYLLWQPADLGVGPRVDYYPFSSKKSPGRMPGFYNSITYGSWGLYRLHNMEHHVKFTGGILIPLKPWRSYNYDLSFGINYHHLGKRTFREPDLNSKLYRSWSYELGSDFKMQRFAICIATDIPRWEPCIGIGFIF